VRCTSLSTTHSYFSKKGIRKKEGGRRERFRHVIAGDSREKKKEGGGKQCDEHVIAGCHQ